MVTDFPVRPYLLDMIDTIVGVGDWEIVEAPVDGPETTELLRVYFTEIVGRFINRIATRDEVDAAIEDAPSADLVRPRGVFLVARHDGVAGGCVGLRMVGPGTVELTRLFVHPGLRRRGAAGLLMRAAEETARDMGAAVIRLETRSDPPEARNLYAANGYVEVPAHAHGGQYADHCFEKRLPVTA